jgi:predicted nucleic acid-binding protein
MSSISEQSEAKLKTLDDLKIAATALAYGLTLVTADQEFSRVPGLSIANWTLG